MIIVSSLLGKLRVFNGIHVNVERSSHGWSFVCMLANLGQRYARRKTRRIVLCTCLDLHDIVQNGIEREKVPSCAASGVLPADRPGRLQFN